MAGADSLDAGSVVLGGADTEEAGSADALPADAGALGSADPAWAPAGSVLAGSVLAAVPAVAESSVGLLAVGSLPPTVSGVRAGRGPGITSAPITAAFSTIEPMVASAENGNRIGASNAQSRLNRQPTTTVKVPTSEIRDGSGTDHEYAVTCELGMY
ncbi:MAG: hypothetical protein ACREFI_20000 [Stellaceae bacterium]